MTVRIINADVREGLRGLPDASVHCVVTSPPYYELRDYGTATWEGGDPACDHRAPSRQGATGQRADRTFTASVPYRDTCGKCGARRVDRQIGLGETPEEYIATLVAVFRAVHRVLRDDGTLWLNCGDSYATNGYRAHGDAERRGQDAMRTVGNGYKAKDLMLMPARLALALQSDGWWVRSDIIWHKPNPMPESTTDRPTSAHEHVFLLTKSATYFYDASAIAEPAINAGRVVNYDGTQKNCLAGDEVNDRRTLIARPIEVGATRSCRNVWTIATEAFPDAHFAVYPTELVSRCIRAGTSERGCCAECGAPWIRADKEKIAGYNERHGEPLSVPRWLPSCNCNAAVVPATVLDPFAGAFTTCVVAERLQRNSIGIELSKEYCRMGRERIEGDAPLFAEVAD